jgi:hypothetical protein
VFTSSLLDKVERDTVGEELSIRAVGNREPPAKMTLQIAIVGSAAVQLQARLARTAPWVDLGEIQTRSQLIHLDPVPFLRAVASGMKSGSSVSAWATWGW